MLSDRLRARQEGEIRRAMSRLNKAKREELLLLMGTPPDLSRVPASFWASLEDDTTALLLLLLLAMHDQAADRIETGVGQRLDPTARLQAATTFAEKRAGLIGKGVARSTKKRLESAAKKLKAGKIKSLGETQLRRVIGNQHATDIGITETSNANATGEIDAVNKIRTGKAPPTLDNGPLDKAPEIIAKWVTERDGRVCPICIPLRNKPESVWRRFFPEGPPAHPRCRCDIDYQAGGRQVSPRKTGPPDNLTIVQAGELLADKGYTLQGGAGFDLKAGHANYFVTKPTGGRVVMSSAEIKRIIR